MQKPKAAVSSFWGFIGLFLWSCPAYSSSGGLLPDNSVASVSFQSAVIMLFVAVLVTAFVMSVILKFLFNRQSKRLTDAFSVIPLHIAIVDRQGNFLYRQFSHDISDISLKPLRKFNDLPEEMVGKFKEPLEQVFLNGAPCTLKYVFQERMRQVEFRKVPLGVLGKEAVIWFASDVEELNQSKERLKQTKEWLKLALESIGDGIVVTDANGVITIANNATATMTGYKRDEMIGKQSSEVLNLVSCLDDNPVQSPILKSISTRKIIEFSNHTDLISRDGKRLHIADSAAPIIDADGNISGSVMVFRDVTSEYEKRDNIYLQNRMLQAVAAVAEITYFRCDIHGNLIDDKVNQRLRGVIGDDKIYEGNWIYEEDKKEYREKWRQLLSHETDTIDLFYRAVHDDELLYFELKVEKSTTPVSGIDGYLGIFKNVTKLKKSEQNYIHTNQLLQNIIENYPCPLFVKDVDDDFRYIVSSRIHTELCGTFRGTNKAIIDSTDFELFTPEVANYFHNYDLEAINDPDTVFDVIERVKLKDDTTNAIRMLRKVLYRKDGRRLLLGIGIDVSRQEEAERELAKTNRLLQTIMDNLPCALFVKDPDDEYRYIMSNRSFALFVGHNVEDMPGKTDFDIFIRHEDAAGCRTSDATAVESGKVFDCREIVMSAKREIHTLHCIKTTVDYEEGRRLLMGICIDITSQEFAERELAKANRLFQTVMDNLPCALFVKDPTDDYRYIMSNQAFASFMGQEVDKMPGKTDFDIFIRKEDASGCRVSDTAAVESGRLFDCREVVMDCNREIRTLHCIKTTFEYDDGQRLLVGICLDVTSQEFAERELSRTSRLLQTILDNLPCAVFVKDPDNDYRYIMANPTFAAFMGYAVEDMPGKTDYDIFIRPSDADGCRRSDSGAVESGEVVDCKEVVMGGDRNTYVLRCVKSTVDYDDGQRLLMGICLDITVQEEAERKLSNANTFLQGILENLPISFWVKDPRHENRFVIANRALHQMLEVPPGSLLGKTSVEVFGEEEGWYYNERDQIVLKESSSLEQDEIMVVNGKTIYLQMRRFILEGVDGNPLILGTGVDVTERVNSRNELQRSNGILNALLNNLPALIAVKNPLNDFRYVIWNNVASDITGLPAAEVIGKRCDELALPFPKSLVSKGVDIEVSRGRRVDDIHKILNHNNQYMFLKTVKTRIPLDGDNSLILTLGMDITEQKLLERQLTDLTSSLRSYIEQEQLVGATLETIALTNDDDEAMNKVLEVLGERLEADYCYLFKFGEMPKRINVIAKYVATGVGKWLEDYVSYPLTDNEPWYDIMASRQVFEHINMSSNEGRRVMGSLAPMFVQFGLNSSAFAIGIWKNDELWGGIGLLYSREQHRLKELNRTLLRSATHIIEIILERQNRRRQLARSEYEKLMIMDSIKIPIMLFDTGLNIIQTNKAAHQLFNSKNIENHDSGENQYVPVSFDSKDYLLPVAMIDSNSLEEHVEEISYNNRDYMLSSYPLQFDDKLVYYLKTLVDVTDYNEVRRKLVSALSAAERANKTKSFFLATVSHELRTPLNVVIGFSELLKQGGMSPEEQLDYIQSINLAGNALLNLINDVLDLSKIEADQMEIIPTPIDVSKIFDEIMSIFGYKAKQKKIKFLLERPAELPIMELDSLRLRQILLNVVGNALKFTNEGYVRILIAFTSDSAEKTGTMIIKVVDTGVGISSEYKSRIFEPFVQQRSTRASNNEGTGLGLTITSRLISKMGGTIELESEVGNGSTFTITLPGISYDYPECKAQAKENMSLGIADKAKKLDILIVDDVQVNLKVLKAMLKRLDLDCREAGSGEEALAKIDKKIPDMILTDMWMPNLNGHDLACRVRQDPRCENVKIIAITADSETNANFNMDCFDDIFLKPLTLEKLCNLFGEENQDK